MNRAERWIVYPTLVALVIAVFGGFVPVRTVDADAGKTVTYSTVRCGQLEILGADGKPTAVLGNTKDGGVLFLHDKKQVALVEMRVNRGSGMLRLLSNIERPRPMAAILGDKRGFGRIAVYGEDPKHEGAVMHYDRTGGGMFVNGPSGRPAAGFAVMKSGTGFCAVNSADGTARTFLGTNKHGGVVGVKDTAGEAAVILHVTPAGGHVQTTKK